MRRPTPRACRSPATTAVQLALVEQLRSWGVTAAAAVGHSSGEICAAYTAGAVTLEEAMELAFYRGSAITEHSSNAGNAGGMAAVGLSEAQLTPYLEKYPKLVIGCYNSPNALTVSGDKAQLEALCAELQGNGVFCRPLVVTHAFHSPFMEPAMPAYRAAIRHVKGRALHCPAVLLAARRGGDGRGGHRRRVLRGEPDTPRALPRRGGPHGRGVPAGGVPGGGSAPCAPPPLSCSV